MKVLFLRSNPVRPDSRVEKEVDALVKCGYDVFVLGWDRDENYPLREEPLNENLPNVTAYRVGIKASYGSGIKNIRFLLKFQKEIRKFLKKNRFDIIHACDFDTAFTAYHSIDHKRIKFVYDIFDYYADAFSIPSFFRKTIIKLDRQIINGADVCIICSEQRREQIAGSNPKNLVVIHNSPPCSILQENRAERVADGPIRIAYFGILSASRLIKEMVNIVIADKRFELHIGGFGVLESYITDVAANNPNIYFYGKVPYSDVLKIEYDCDILTAIYDPTVRNHFYAAPNKFYESLMLGKPVIMAKGTGMSDVVLKHDIGVTIDFSEAGLKDGLDILVSRREQWPAMSTRMLELYNCEYSWEEMERRLVSAYKSI